MRKQTLKQRRQASIAAARAVKAQRAEQRNAPAPRKQAPSLPAGVLAYAIRTYVGDGLPLATVQRSAADGVAGAALTLSAFERLAERRMARSRGMRSVMRESNCASTRVRLAWPDTADRTPAAWARRIVAPEGGIARLAWREQLVRHGAAAAAAWCEARGIGWQYPATAADVVRQAPRADVVLATTAADRAALADGTA